MSLKSNTELMEEHLAAENTLPTAGEVYVTPQMFGAAGDGTTDDTVAIQTMFNSAGADKKVCFPAGEYLTTAPITVPNVPDIEMDGMIIANHSGIALFLGSTTVYTLNKSIKIKLKKYGFTGTAVEDGSIGLQIGAFARSTFYLAFVNGFETNVKLLTEDNAGVFFNTFHIDDLNYAAKYGLYLDGTDGWINDNLFIGGSIGKGKTNGGAAVTIIHGGQNLFLKNGMEGAGTCVNIVSGRSNTFLYSRCEASTVALQLGEEAGGDNTMTESYRDAVCVNNSKFSSSGIIAPGIRDICRHTAVNIPSFANMEVLNITDTKSIFKGLRFIDSTSNAISYYALSSHVLIEDGILKVNGSQRPFFEFDTTKNKRFEFPSEPYLGIVVYTADGKVDLTEENFFNYIKTTHQQGYNSQFQAISNYYNNCCQIRAVQAVEVPSEVIKVEFVFLDRSIDHLSILTDVPCIPVGDTIIEVTSLPTNGYLGDTVNYNGALYMYNGTQWKAV